MLHSLQARNFRCFEQLAVEFGAHFNVFLGANGQGKTSILEAACILLRLQSQRTSSLANVVRFGANSFLARGHFAKHTLEIRYGEKGRNVRFDGNEQRTFGDYLRLGRVVSMANSDIELTRAVAEPRRRFLDFTGAQIKARYRPILRAYERALRARNALLKMPGTRARELAAYEALFIENGTQLMSLRARLVEAFAPRASQAYEQISRGREKLLVTYFPGASDDLARDLERTRAESARLRLTIVGPHRDDLLLTLDGTPVAQFASEGQQRTIALAIKIAQAQIFNDAINSSAPLLLVDDVFGELDVERRNALLDNLPAASQKFVTATAIPWRDEIAADYVYELRDRQIGLV